MIKTSDSYSICGVYFDIKRIIIFFPLHVISCIESIKSISSYPAKLFNIFRLEFGERVGGFFLIASNFFDVEISFEFFARSWFIAKKVDFVERIYLWY